MELSHEEHILHVLKDCYDQGKFDAFYPYLAEDVKRTSMWYREDIVGKDKVIEYFQMKEREMANNNHYFAQLARLKYVDGQPLTMARKVAVTAEGSQAGDELIPKGSQLSFYYDEHQLVLLLELEIHLKISPTLISLEFNREGLIEGYHLMNSELYAYEIEPEYGVLSYDALQFIGITEAALHFHNEGYIVDLEDYVFNRFPHFIITKNHISTMVAVFTDHAPYIGYAETEIIAFMIDKAHQQQMEVIIVNITVQGKGDQAHRILTTDPYEVNIIEILDAQKIERQKP